MRTISKIVGWLSKVGSWWNETLNYTLTELGTMFLRIGLPLLDAFFDLIDSLATRIERWLKEDP